MLVSVAIGAMAMWLAYANGANDNFKGVATLFGSETTDYRQALLWGTGTTLAGSIAAMLLAGRLIEAFSGRGLVVDSLASDPRFLLSVAAATAVVVMGATLLALPVSTTHALVGGLAGAAVGAAGLTGVSWSMLGGAFAAPLLLAPLMAAVAVAGVYPVLRGLRIRLGVRHDDCVCVQPSETLDLAVGHGGSASMRLAESPSPRLRFASVDACGLGYEGSVLGMTSQRLLDAVHYLSAGAVSFARGLNDTPKIAALLIAGAALDARWSLVAVGIGISAGALLQGRRVGHTMSHRITRMNTGQGFTANAVTALTVLLATRYGLPASVTHVSTGALFGLGANTGQLHTGTFRAILLAWLATLPAAFVAGWITYHLLT